MRLHKLFLSSAFIFFSFFINAQDKLTFNIHGGVNYSSLRFEDNRISKHNSEVNYLLGLSSSFYLKKKIYLDIEVNYERKMVSVYVPEIIINSVSFGGNFRVYDIYEFLTLPIMLRYEIGNINSFYVKGGLFLGYFLTAKERINKGKLSQDLSKYFTGYDFGLSIGAGKTFSLGNSNKLILELRNNLGLTNIDTQTSSDTFNAVLINEICPLCIEPMVGTRPSIFFL